MNKRYFLIKPSEFERLDDIDIDGNVAYQDCADFEGLSDERENVLIFEGEVANPSKMPRYVTEIISGERFAVTLLKNKRDVNITNLSLSSDSLGLYMKRGLPIQSVERKGIQATGLLYHITDTEENERLYCSQIKEMFDEAAGYKYTYDQAVNGPSKFIRRELGRTYRRS